MLLTEIFISDLLCSLLCTNISFEPVGFPPSSVPSAEILNLVLPGTPLWESFPMGNVLLLSVPQSESQWGSGALAILPENHTAKCFKCSAKIHKVFL